MCGDRGLGSGDQLAPWIWRSRDPGRSISGLENNAKTGVNGTRRRAAEEGSKELPGQRRVTDGPTAAGNSASSGEAVALDSCWHCSHAL
jgi:hypothetical protein